MLDSILATVVLAILPHSIAARKIERQQRLYNLGTEMQIAS